MPTPDEIVEQVREREGAHSTLRQRMEDDWDMYRLAEYNPDDEDITPFTSSDPQTFANKIISWLSSAKRITRVPIGDKFRQEREATTLRERFCKGALQSANDRLVHMLRPSLQSQLAWYCSIRGMYAGRSVLVKRSDNSTYVDITPWDPLHVFWQVGENGLLWACHRFQMLPAQIRDEFGRSPTGRSQRLDFLNDKDDNDPVEVYDYYDREGNTVIVESDYLKRTMRHVLPGRVPCFIGPVGDMPVVQPMSGESDMSTFGESVFKSSRTTSTQFNDVMSRMYTLVRRSVKEGVKVRSVTGTKTLDESPFAEGSEISLAEGEDIEPLGLMRMASDTGPFLGLVSGERQRSMLPHTSYGALEFQLSGYAIDTLRAGIDSAVQPCIQAMNSAYDQICNNLLDQYQTGSFLPMTMTAPLSSHEREWFQEVISPEAIRGAGPIQNLFVPDLPKDNPAKYSMAQMARDGAVPLLADRTIRSDVLELEDVDQEEDKIKEQLAERVSPMAAAYTLMQAAEKRGRPDLARIYMIEAMIQHLQTQMQLMQGMSMAGGMPGAGGPGGGPGGGGPGGGPSLAGGGGPGGPMAPPTASPPQAQGIPQAPPTPQAGPIVPPGTPRPGALSPAERLAAMGLSMGVEG